MINNKNIYLFGLSLIFSLNFANAQELLKIAGKVVNDKGYPLNDVSVSVQNKTKKTTTYINGNFNINAQKGDVLYFSHPEFSPVEYDIDFETDSLSINLKPISNEQIYNIAYGKRAKSQLTGAFSQIKSKDLERSPVATLDNAIQGRVTGVTVEHLTGAEPGFESTDIFIRGLGTFGNGKQPLIIVDNIERDFRQLNPEEIETFTVLKDAAATAAYGMRAANGVILVTTKRGYEGKTQISLNAQVGVQQPTRLPEYLGSSEYIKFRNIAMRNDGLIIPDSPLFNPDMYNGLHDPYTYADTDWYNQFLNITAPIQKYDLSVRGGTKEVKYYVLFGVTDQQGLYKYSNINPGYNTNISFTRYNLRSNIDINLNKNLSMSVDLAGRIESRNMPNSSASSIFQALANMSPTIPVFNRDNSIAGNSDYQYNPYGMISKTGYRVQNKRFLQGNIGADYKLDFLLKGLSVNGLFAFDSYKLYGRSKNQTYAVFQENVEDNFDNEENVIGSKYSYSSFGKDTDAALNFSNSDDDYSLQTSFIAGINYNAQYERNRFALEAKYHISSTKVSGNNPNFKQENLFGRLTYDFDKRYVIEGSVAYTGSEDFQGKNRYGTFPVGSAAWIISNEEFFSSSSFISYLKLRGSYGMVGNSSLGLGRFPFESAYYGGGGYIFGSSFAGSDGAYEGRIYNPNITWEKSINSNIGLDLELFKEKVILTADVFKNDRSRIITTRENILPGVVGQSLPYENSGRVESKGIELSLTSKNTINKFSYLITANASLAKNIIKEMEEVAGLYPYQYKEGTAVGQAWGLVALGLFNNQEEIDNHAISTYGTVKPGDIKYADLNNDGFINDDDMTSIGNCITPEWNFGLNAGFSYRGVDFNVLFTGVANRSVYAYNNAIMGMYNNVKVTKTAYDTWQAGINESTARFPRLSLEENAHNYKNSTMFLFNGDYIRLQNVEIGYTLPKKFVNKHLINQIRFFANGYNLLSLDHLKKYNLSAEVPDAGVMSYPEMRIINLGVNVKF